MRTPEEIQKTHGERVEARQAERSSRPADPLAGGYTIAPDGKRVAYDRNHLDLPKS